MAIEHDLPLVVELPWRPPADALVRLAGLPMPVFLDSSAEGDRLSTWSYLAVDPFLVVEADGAVVRGDDRPGGATDPHDALARLLHRYREAPRPDLPPFAGGLAGYLGFGFGHYLEAVPRMPAKAPIPPDMVMGAYDLVLAWHHPTGRLRLLSTGRPGETPDERRRIAAARARMLLGRLDAAAPPDAPSQLPVRHHRPWLERAAFEAKVQRVIDYIRAGDVFQVNLAQRFSFELPDGLSPLDLYRRLRVASPAPFAAYIGLKDAAILSSSPERFLAADAEGRVEARPIKGTRRRGRSEAEDALLAAELARSAKDRAENVMIVDLMRNDLSRVCRPESVEVPELCVIERYAQVLHLVSAVTGVLRPGQGAVDLLRAAFPGGSITGAPKIRACQIIAELEPVARGPYCGAIGWLGFDGAMDTNIAIRTVTIQGREGAYHVGGGIVLDSDPAAEYEETIVKAAGIRRALGVAP